jgi:hypothetical protein
MAIRAFIVQSPRPSKLRHRADKISPRAFVGVANYVVKDDLRCAVDRE